MDTIADLISTTEAYEHELPPAAPLPPAPQGKEIAGWLDQTLVRPDASEAQIRTLCEEACRYHFAAVYVNPVNISQAVYWLKDSQVAIASVAGYPLGANLPTVKMVEALADIAAGASEIDIVLDIGALKSQAYGRALDDLQMVAQAIHAQKAILKVIIETGLLTYGEKILACLLCKAARADFVKTSTGLGYGGATVDDVDLMYRTVGPTLKIKAAGGIRSLANAQALIKAGASRLGTSVGVQIVQEASS